MQMTMPTLKWFGALAILGVAFSAQAKDGFFLGFGLGGGIVSGDGPIEFGDNATLDPDYQYALAHPGSIDLRKLHTTDVGSGFGTSFRLGYNILGIVSLEAQIGGSGNHLGDSDRIEGQVGVLGVLRLYPAQFFPEVADRWWDPYLAAGGGVHFMGYNPKKEDGSDLKNDGRAWWPAPLFTYGLGCDFYPVPFLSLGVDLAFFNAFHNNFRYDEDKDPISPKETATVFIFQPTATITFHFGAH